MFSKNAPLNLKKSHENRGVKGTYLAEGTHPAIIAMEQFLAVQAEKKRRSNMVLDEYGEYHRATQRYSMRVQLSAVQHQQVKRFCRPVHGITSFLCVTIDIIHCRQYIFNIYSVQICTVDIVHFMY